MLPRQRRSWSTLGPSPPRSPSCPLPALPPGGIQQLQCPTDPTHPASPTARGLRASTPRTVPRALATRPRPDRMPLAVALTT
eukprot:2183650-Alexandrium_andersonii.AAC.1